MKKRLEKIITAPLLYLVFMKIRPFTRRSVLLALCAFALAVYSIFSFAVIGRLKSQTGGLADAYVELIHKSISLNAFEAERNAAIRRILDKAINPCIVTDTAWKPILWSNISHRNIYSGKKEPLPEKLDEEQRKFLDRKIRSLRRSFKPRPIYLGENSKQLMGYLVFGNSILIRSLYIMPFIEIGLGAAFISLLYLAFHNIRVTERSNLWVGLAKETAHQLGTPISSIMGWVEYLRTILDGSATNMSNEVQQILVDMHNDLNRLSKITARFSQIGSAPSMAACDISNILTDVSSYFKMRLPLLRKRISIECDFNRLPLVHANRDLLEWVFENMLKKAIDAITSSEGNIVIRTEHLSADGKVRIQIRDNGHGISWETQKRIFSPGYTTKRRGWGLGLTLAKRIIEDYHNGEIYIAWTQRDKGTVFNVDLPVVHEKNSGTVA